MERARRELSRWGLSSHENESDQVARGSKVLLPNILSHCLLQENSCWFNYICLNQTYTCTKCRKYWFSSGRLLVTFKYLSHGAVNRSRSSVCYSLTHSFHSRHKVRLKRFFCPRPRVKVYGNWTDTLNHELPETAGPLKQLTQLKHLKQLAPRQLAHAVKLHTNNCSSEVY